MFSLYNNNMKKKNILKKSYEFNRIINTIKPFRYKYLKFYVERIEDNNYYFGFSVGKKIGKAVVRNKIKRQIKAIIQKNKYKNGFNCIIIVNSSILDRTFQEIEKDINDALKRLDILNNGG
ncbi:MAG: ribonuclease P protein component [Mollicutes bacterium]|nr:ribonuclease P protein component [Mollicutes bacterium]